MHFLDTLQQTMFWRLLDKFQRGVMAGTSILIVLMVCIGVVCRDVFQGDFYGSEELIQMLAFWLYFMGASQGSRGKSQISADILTCYIHNPRRKQLAKLVSDFVTLSICLLVTVWAIQFVTWGFVMTPKSPVFKLPMYIPQSAVGLGFILMSFYHLVYFLQDLKAFLTNQIPSAAPLEVAPQIAGVEKCR
jgi:TRAP-type C4-dicarboxylate transport system permease small subunit